MKVYTLVYIDKAYDYQVFGVTSSRDFAVGWQQQDSNNVFYEFDLIEDSESFDSFLIESKRYWE